MPGDDVRSVMISGEAVKALSDGGTRKRAPKRKTAQEGGNSLQGGNLLQGANSLQGANALRGVSANMMIIKGVESPSTTSAASPSPSTWLKAPVEVPPRIHVAGNQTNQIAAPTSEYKAQGGDNKSIKVELKKKATVKKVKLHPKKVEAVKTPKKNQTKKSRKITLGMASLHKRLTRAKKVHHTMKHMPIDTLKKLLIQKKLIKPTSKAPESILRQIAVDSHIVEGKSL
jgi:hypothetical protein